jgi:hypothetical protein
MKKYMEWDTNILCMGILPGQNNRTILDTKPSN